MPLGAASQDRIWRMAARLVAISNPTGAFTLTGAAFLFGLGFAIWVAPIVLHSYAERVQPKE
ncbi:hypothetical protein GCM10007159_42270 [Modicisalibacter luteus]|nr:hypothetical protein GCM10007159_42270 [Halomonas lutea]